LTLLTILEVYSEARKAGQTFSEMTKPYLKYQQAEDLMVDVKDKKLALKKVEDYLKGLKPKTLKHFDGLIVDFGNVWGAVKPSVTEYALNVMFESLNRKTAVEMQSKLIKYIQSIAND
jgi:phosphomannomutase